MRRIFKGLFKTPQISTLQPCRKHQLQGAQDIPIIPYTTDHCKSCHEHLCHVCSENHVSQHCEVELGIVKDVGQGVEASFNVGDLMKVDLQRVKCICGKALGSGAAICAACGMASCSEACHRRWEQEGNCVFSKNFYSTPEGSTMRSILFDNVYKMRDAKIREWSIANRSPNTMVCIYVSSDHDYVFLQRGYRNYGRPNDQLLLNMETMPRTIDFYTHYDRRCDCSCLSCANRPVHSANNCQASCADFELEYMEKEAMKPENHRQCSCSCEFCSSGIVVTTHRLIDCMPFCRRSTYWRDNDLF